MAVHTVDATHVMRVRFGTWADGDWEHDFLNLFLNHSLLLVMFQDGTAAPQTDGRTCGRGTNAVLSTTPSSTEENKVLCKVQVLAHLLSQLCTLCVTNNVTHHGTHTKFVPQGQTR